MSSASGEADMPGPEIAARYIGPRDLSRFAEMSSQKEMRNFSYW